MKAIYYFDSRGREILHLPLVFVVINYARQGVEVILNPNKLKRRLKLLKMNKKSLDSSLIFYPDISKEDVDSIEDLCFEGKIQEAKNYCVDLFDGVANKEVGIDNVPRRYR